MLNANKMSLDAINAELTETREMLRAGNRSCLARRFDLLDAKERLVPSSERVTFSGSWGDAVDFFKGPVVRVNSNPGCPVWEAK